MDLRNIFIIKYLQIKTASGTKLMPALKLDKINILDGKEIFNVFAIISTEISFEDFKVIIPADIV